MNIFIMLLVFLFMAGYYFITSPDQTVQKHTTEYAIDRADLRAVAECTASVQTSIIRGLQFDDLCIERYQITTNLICLNNSLTVIKCDNTKNKKTDFNFIVTTTGILPENEFNNMLEIMEDYYPNAGNFGVFIDKVILSGSGDKRTIPEAIINTAKLENGQLVYVTQFGTPDTVTDFTNGAADDVKCSFGTVKVYKFGKWQCIEQNTKATCVGDTIWDSDLSKCVADESRKPLCSSKQTAVMVDDLWECIDPFSNKTCPTGMIPKLNYTSLEWECITDPSKIKTTKSCDNLKGSAVYGGIGSTLRIPVTSCTDCEKMITDTTTCETKCIPDTSKLSDTKCYSNVSECTGSSRAFYFGFPSSTYVANVSAVASITVPFDTSHSQNRKFNCLDCGTGTIDTDKSLSPYVAVCK